MNKIQVLLIIGSRPEAIKLAPVVVELRARSGAFDTFVCSTGQQRDLIPQVLRDFDLEPDISLDAMRPSQNLHDLTARLTSELGQLLQSQEPSWVLVQGDTTSAFVGALCAFYNQIPVAHVEAGLRTRDIYSPFPEEVNRRLITQCSTIHFAATVENQQNLIAENIEPSSIHITGNTVVDALLFTRNRIRKGQTSLCSELQAFSDQNPLILITTHRRESFGKPLEQICTAVLEIARTFTNYRIVFPVHPNPNVSRTVTSRLSGIENILLTTPLSYSNFVELMDRSDLILTDSGGVQEEAPTLQKPVVVLRESTERNESVASGSSILVGTDPEKIFNRVYQILTDKEYYRKITSGNNPYGDGLAAQRIAEILMTYPAKARANGPQDQ